MIQAIPKRRTREEILELSASLFAQHGYDGVSMRDVAVATRLTPAALYYHFSDKEHLYLDSLTHEFREKSATLKATLEGTGSPWERLEGFVADLARLTATDKQFLRLLQWVLLDCDEVRQRKLAESAFKDMFVSVHDLAGELGSHHDAHMLAISIFGLVIFPYQTETARHFMPGNQRRQDKPAVLARHVCNLLRTGLNAPSGGAC